MLALRGNYKAKVGVRRNSFRPYRTEPHFRGSTQDSVRRGANSILGYFRASLREGSSVASLKFIEEQPQILRLTTPELKGVRGPVRSE